MDLTTLLAGPLGGALGLFGALAQKWMGMKEAKQGHEFKMAEMELASKVDLQKADILLRSTVEEKAGDAFRAAIDAQAGIRPTASWALNVLSLFRPGLTAFLIIASTALAVLYRHSQPELLQHIVASLFGMSTVATGYWFGARENTKMQVTPVKR